MTKYEINKPYPGAYPQQEGVVMELGQGGLIVFIQMPGLQKNERKGFKKGFKKYGYFESDTPVPISIWTFGFSPVIDTNFNARVANPEYIRAFLEPEDGQVKNLLTMFLLDGNILKGIKTVGLHPEAVELFHATIQKQLETEYSQADYDRYLSAIFSYSSEELMRMGKQFTMKK